MAATAEPLEAGASRLLQLVIHLTGPSGLSGLAPPAAPGAARRSGLEALAPAVVRLRLDPESPFGLEVAVKPLDDPGTDLHDVLAGFVAPADWFGVGAVAGGWTRRLDHDGHVGPRSGRALTVMLVTRDGCEAGALLRPGYDPVHMCAGPGGRPALGAVPDLLRAVLGLAPVGR